MRRAATIACIIFLIIHTPMMSSALDLEISVVNPDDILLNSFRLSASNQSRGQGVIASDVAVMGAFGRAVFIDQESLRMLWKTSFEYSVPDAEIPDFVTMTRTDEGIPLAIVRSPNGKELVCYNAALGVEKWRIKLTDKAVASNIVIYESGDKLAYGALNTGAMIEIRVSVGTYKIGPIIKDFPAKCFIRVKDVLSAEASNGDVILISRKDLTSIGKILALDTTTDAKILTRSVLMPGYIITLLPNGPDTIAKVYSATTAKGIIPIPTSDTNIEGKLACPPIEFGIGQIAIMTDREDGSQKVSVYHVSSSNPEKIIQPQRMISIPSTMRIVEPVLVPKINRDTIGDFFIIGEKYLVEIELPESFGANDVLDMGGKAFQDYFSRVDIGEVLNSGKLGPIRSAMFMARLQISADTQSFFIGVRLGTSKDSPTALLGFSDLIEYYEKIKEFSVIDNGVFFQLSPLVQQASDKNRAYFMTTTSRVGYFETDGATSSNPVFIGDPIESEAYAMATTESGKVLILSASGIKLINLETKTLASMEPSLGAGETFAPYLEVVGNTAFIVDSAMKLYAVTIDDERPLIVERRLPGDLFDIGNKIVGLAAATAGKDSIIAVASTEGVVAYRFQINSGGSSELTLLWSYATEAASISVSRNAALGTGSGSAVIVTESKGKRFSILDPLGNTNGNQGELILAEEDANSGNDILKRIVLTEPAIRRVLGNHLFYFVPTAKGLDLYLRSDGSRAARFSTESSIAFDPLYIPDSDILVFVDTKGQLSFANLKVYSLKIMDRFSIGRSIRTGPVMLNIEGKPFVIVQSSDGDTLIFDAQRGAGDEYSKAHRSSDSIDCDAIARMRFS